MKIKAKLQLPQPTEFSILIFINRAFTWFMHIKVFIVIYRMTYLLVVNLKIPPSKSTVPQPINRTHDLNPTK